MPSACCSAAFLTGNFPRSLLIHSMEDSTDKRGAGGLQGADEEILCVRVHHFRQCLKTLGYILHIFLGVDYGVDDLRYAHSMQPAYSTHDNNTLTPWDQFLRLLSLKRGGERTMKEAILERSIRHQLRISYFWLDWKPYCKTGCVLHYCQCKRGHVLHFV